MVELLAPLYALVAQVLPFECMQVRFMQQAMVGLLLLAPMTAVMGIQVVNFRMAFFSDAISHSAFAGVALGLIFAVNPDWTMPLFGLLVGLGIMILLRHSRLSSDTVIGVFFSAMVAFGLAIVSRDRSLARDLQRFLYGDILTISDAQILCLAALLVALMTFQARSYNHLLYIGINPTLAQAVARSQQTRLAQSRPITGTPGADGYQALVQGADEGTVWLMRLTQPLARWLDFLL